MDEIKEGDKVKYSKGYLAARKSCPSVYRPDTKSKPGIVSPTPSVEYLASLRGTVQVITTVGEIHKVALVTWNDGSISSRFVMNLEKVPNQP